MRIVTGLLGALTPFAAAAILASTQAPAEPSLGPLVATSRLADLRWPDFSDYRIHVQRFYETRSWALAWTDGGKVTPQARAIADKLAAADDKGLNAVDYDGPKWAARIAETEAGAASSPDALARFDLALTASVMRYISDLHIGRINPKNLGHGLDIEHKKYDLPQLLGSLVATGEVGAALDAVEPQYEYYRDLQEALRRYRVLAARFADWSPLPAAAVAIKPGTTYVGMPRLAELLVALGDLPAERKEAASRATYGDDMLAAVKSFQQRHGLAPDGALGKGTFTELNTPLAERVGQMQLTLERFRWVEQDFGEPPIVVNVPAFRLRAFERTGNGVEPALKMNVIVGKEYPGTRTPIFAKKMLYLVFSPYWEVPPSIARKELIPKMTPEYAEARDYVIEGERGRLPVGAESLALVRAGKARIRQKPGKNNALGAVKFMFPNEHNVYLHSTSSPSLFSRPERALSHGCIRVADPAALAELVLRDNEPAWDRSRIEAAMSKGEPTQVELAKPIWVYILYGTALVDEEGRVRFYRDVYGHDRVLAAALAKGYPYPP